MAIKLKREHPGAIQAHGEATYPNECCGLMLGRLVQGDKHILELLPAENARKESEQRNRFLISPRNMFEAEKRAREKGMDVLGFYHSPPQRGGQALPVRPGSCLALLLIPHRFGFRWAGRGHDLLEAGRRPVPFQSRGDRSRLSRAALPALPLRMHNFTTCAATWPEMRAILCQRARG